MRSKEFRDLEWNFSKFSFFFLILVLSYEYGTDFWAGGSVIRSVLQ